VKREEAGTSADQNEAKQVIHRVDSGYEFYRQRDRAESDHFPIGFGNATRSIRGGLSFGSSDTVMSKTASKATSARRQKRMILIIFTMADTYSTDFLDLPRFRGGVRAWDHAI
jgi:hypothetical protein